MREATRRTACGKKRIYSTKRSGIPRETGDKGSKPLCGAGNGADGQTRTDDLLITNQLLYQLSYVGLLLIRLYRCSRVR